MAEQSRELRDRLIEQAMDLLPGQRTEFVRGQCLDAAMAREIESLLDFAANTRDSSFSLPVQAMAAVAGSRTTLHSRIGPYRIERLLGEGGMGAVYQGARDDDQFQKQVAIKLVRGWAQTETGLLRFRQERQILANLEHPNIARLLDGGNTPEGLPFLVMEYVPGEPINAYCAAQQLSTKDRLELFRQVCEPVQYAHQNLVVHRDLKPSNILVTVDGTPKLLDFGIAKLLDPETAVELAAPQTGTGLALMTADYASPEQVRGQRVSVATDVYSLGAVLYELLTGHRPHQLKSYDPAEIVQRVCVDSVQPPSAWGNASLRGDLDTILCRAMEKEPSRRYNSIAQFSEDIHRHLSGLPIMAHPDTLSYRVGKFIRRHYMGVAAVIAVMLALSGGMAVALMQARLAQERFDDVRAMANRFLFDFHDSIVGLEGATKARELVVSTALEYLNRLARKAGGDRVLQRELAAAYVKVGRVQGYPGEPNLGRIADARRSFQEAVDLYGPLESKTAANLEQALDPMVRLAYLESDQENFERSLEWSNRAQALIGDFPLQQMTPSLVAAYAEARMRMSNALEGVGDSEAAYEAVREGEQILNRYAALNKTGAFESRPQILLRHLDSAARLSGRLEEAMAALEELRRKYRADNFYWAR
jgi:tetratricopeptide (TPR) repeat protein